MAAPLRANAAKAVSTRRSVTTPGRKHVRAVLPSGRVCCFLVPNVGEHMEMSEEAVSAVQRRCAKADPPVDPTERQYGTELLRRAVRKLLVGISAAPVPAMYLPGMSATTVRTTAEATLRADLARDNPGAEAADIDAAVAERLPAIIEPLLAAAEDANAMCAAANLQPVGDLQWNEGEGVGAYLQSLPVAALGSTDAADWVALHEIVGHATRGQTGPKAQTPVRSLRISTAD